MMLSVGLSFGRLLNSMILVFIIVTLGTLVHSQGYTCDTTLRGFATLGAGTTGGGNVAPITVTDIDDMRKACEGNQPAVIRVSGTIDTGPIPVTVGSNKSIIGLNGATIRGGLNMTYGTSNVIIRYLTIIGAGFGNSPDDTIAGRGTTNVWVDHCELSNAGRRLLAMTKGSDLVTVSYNKFSYTDRRVDRIATLMGASSVDGEIDQGKLRATFHHNHFAENVTEGMARLHFGPTHLANNFYNAPGNNYVIGIGTGSQILIENNMFLNMRNPIAIRDNDTLGFVTEAGNIYKDTVGDKVTGPVNGGNIPFTKPPYVLDLVPASEVEELVLACANAKAP